MEDLLTSEPNTSHPAPVDTGRTVVVWGENVVYHKVMNIYVMNVIMVVGIVCNCLVVAVLRDQTFR